MRKRDCVIKCRLNEKEMAAFKKTVAKTGLTTDSYLRMIIQNRIPKQLPPIEYYQMIDEFRKIGEALEKVSIRALLLNREDKQIYEENYMRAMNRLLYIEKLITIPDQYREDGSN